MLNTFRRHPRTRLAVMGVAFIRTIRSETLARETSMTFFDPRSGTMYRVIRNWLYATLRGLFVGRE
jgi:hypothetical protein